jgi:glycerol-3-phosphate dehydrogenase
LLSLATKQQQIQTDKEESAWVPPQRSSLIQSLKNDAFDLLVIGGGATGTGVALDVSTSD